MASLRTRDGFDWRKVVWSPPDGQIAPICSYCQGGINEVPFMMWDPGGACCQFCDGCVEKWFYIK